MLFADGGITVDTLTILAILGGAASVVGVLFKLLISSKDALIAANEKAHQLALQQLAAEKVEEESRKKSYQEIAAEAVKSALETTNYYRAKDGKPPVILVAPVISESHSPSTAAQRETAAIATQRAVLAAVKVAAGQEPRLEPPHELEAGKPQQPTPASRSSIDAIRTIERMEKTIEEVPAKTADLVVEKIEGKESGG